MEQNQKSMEVSASADSPSKDGPRSAPSKESAGSGRPAKKRAADRANRGSSSHGGKSGTSSPGKGKPSKPANRVRETRIERMMSKAELARRAGISVLTIDR